MIRFQPSDFHTFTGGTSSGKNDYARDTRVMGIDFEYLWRERGMEPGGTLNPRLDIGLRLAWMKGIPELGLDERFRVSPAITWYLEDSRRMSLRLQTNHNRTPDGQTNHSVWLQFNISLGSVGEEVR